MKNLFLLFIAVLSYVTTYAYEVDYKPSDSIRVIKLLNDAKKQPESINYIIYLNSATHIVRNKFKILSNNILPSILPCQKIHLT